MDSDFFDLAEIAPRTECELWIFPSERGWDINNPDALIYEDEVFREALLFNKAAL